MLDKTTNLRLHIANLAAALRKFAPAEPLVNEKTIPKKFKALEGAPTMDQLLGLNIAAINELASFIQTFDRMQTAYTGLSADGMVAYQTAIAAGISAQSLTELVETLIGKIKQASDVIAKIHDLTHDDDVLNICKEYTARFVANKPPIPFPGPSTNGGGEN